jgi:TRAP-type C4-dicarboxylate transport system substrate-binding protein
MLGKGVRFIGYGGGSTRHLILKKEVRTIDDFPSVTMRVQGSPLHQKVFSAVGLKATPMDYTEVYNAIKTGVLDGLENEPAGLASMKFYEVAPYYVLTSHQIVTRILAFSEKKFQTLPKDLQDAIVKAGAEAAAFHRATEIGEGDGIIKDLQTKYGLKVIPSTTPRCAEGPCRSSSSSPKTTTPTRCSRRSTRSTSRSIPCIGGRGVPRPLFLGERLCS